MSKRGLKFVSNILFKMQELRIELLRDKSDNQDLLLARCLEDGKDAMQDCFIKATLIKEKKNEAKGKDNKDKV